MVRERVKREALEILGTFQVLPRLIVFDLDYTLWPFYCECQSKRGVPTLYPEAKGIIYALKDKGLNLAIASRSSAPGIANALLHKLEIKPMFEVQEVFTTTSHKTEHFQKIHTRTGVPLNEMLFFDDENRNIEAVSKMGVTSILVGKEGLNIKALKQGLSEFAQNFTALKKNKDKGLKFSKKNHGSQRKSDNEVQLPPLRFVATHAHIEL